MAEFITTLQEIKQLPAEAHLLCPRQDNFDLDRYDEEQDEENRPKTNPAEDELRSARIKEAKVRRKKFISSLQLVSYDGAESEQYQRYIWQSIDEACGKCDLCIRNYYVAKLDFLADLRQEFEEQDVKVFFSVIDQRDISRIKQGLSGATRTLEGLPEQKRGTAALDPAHLHAIFEALICEAFLKDETLLRDYFDVPFRLIQTKKPLRIREILPATTRFLFDANSRRLSWARSIWERIDRRPTELEWNWAIKDFLQPKLQHASDPSEISRLWSGLALILEKLDEWQITHKLLDLVPNVCMTALNHISARVPAFPYIVQTIGLIMEKAPDAFWQAIGSISSQTIAEMVLGSPLFDKYVQESAASRSAQDIEVLSWIPKFLNSLKPANRPAACRVLVNQLFAKIQAEKISIDAKKVCFDMTVKAMLQTLVSFSSNEKTRLSVERLVLSDILSTISHRIEELLDPSLSELADEASKINVLNVVRNALTLECQCLKSDFEALRLNESLRHESSSYSPEIWDAVVKNIHQDDVKLSIAVLQGIMPLPGLEQFRVREGHSLSKEKEAYNNIFDKVTGMVGKVLERLSEFKPEHLDTLFDTQDTSISLIAALFSADQNTYEAAIELIKNISGESGRKEALAHLLEAFLGNTLFGICWTFRRISIMKTFASVPRMLRSGMEILDVLCNSATGKLLRHKLEQRDYAALQNYWSYQWNALRTVFGLTERWSVEVHDKKLMIEVCRDAMQFAEALFEQYDVFASVLTQANPDEAEVVSRQLLDSSDSEAGSPLKAIENMSRWLRLRDEYLADTLVKLIIKMLYRLKQHDAITTSNGLVYVQEVATKSSIKTILSEPHKAMLLRALENYYGRPIERPVKKKQSTLNEWTSSAIDTGSGTSTPVTKTENSGKVLSERAIKDSFEASRSKQISEMIEKPKALSTAQQLARPKKPDPVMVKTAAKQALDSKAFIENRKREEAARKARDREAVLRLRGTTGVGEQTQGQGSGLAGIGLMGKDHSSGPNSLMVSSESESSDDSDDELFGKVQPSKTGVQTVGAKKVLPMAPVRITKQQRSQKDMRARLAPDLTGLHRTILGWDFFAESDLPPNSAKDDYTLVTNVFKSVTEYQKTFEPLLILEGWQGFLAAREDGTFKAFEIKVSSSLIVDNFFEVKSSMSFAEGKELGISTADIVLLSTSKRPEKDAGEPHCFARVKEVTRKKGEVQIVYRVNAANPLRPFLNSKTNVYGISIMSLTPLEREYGALMALPYYDLCDEIISAKPSPLLEYSEAELTPFERRYNLNTAQAKAVKSGLDNDAFTLIQGPPGSGKTKTICALVGAMMTGSVNKESKVGVRSVGQSAAVKNVLVCAPSNAAVDELVMRFKEGVTMMDGLSQKLNVVRLGRSEAINSQVKDVTLEELVTAKINASAPKGSTDDIHSVMMEHKAVSDELNELRAKINDMRGKGQTVPTQDDQLFDGLKRKQKGLGTKIDDIREKQNAASRDAELTRKRIQQEILNSANVLCATLSGSGHEIFQGLNIEFETVIIDEAAQSIELSALIPLKYGCSKCVLVGDPKQLPPTVLSREAAKFQYEQSLFARMEKNHKADIHLLDTQYRMHPEISLFPSKTFYDSRLKDGPDMAQLRARPWHHSNIFAPYRFFDVQGLSQAATKGHSLVNVAEINVAMRLYERLITDVRRYDFTGKIGVITPYKGQLRELKNRFKQRFGEDITSAIDFNTTDAFQGRESEIIIFSCVRASVKGIGFLNDVRRMNVGLTRAKCSLWVLGSSESLVQGEFWRALVSDVKTRNLYTNGDILRMLSQPLLTEDMMKMDVEMLDVSNSSSSAASRQQSISREHRPVIEIQSRTAKLSRSPSSDSNQSSSSSIASIPNLNRNITSKQANSKAVTNEPPKPASAVKNLPNCRICGSDAHFSFTCNNSRAKAALIDNCDRCHLPGHGFTGCSKPRCLECGEVGHISSDCRASQNLRLTIQQKQDLKRQEARFGKMNGRVEASLGNGTQKHTAVHTAPIINTKTSSAHSSSTDGKGDHKRKRDSPIEVISNTTIAGANHRDKAPKTSTLDNNHHNKSAPYPPSNTSNIHSADKSTDSAAAAVARATPPPTHNGIPTNPKPGQQMPMVRKKKVRGGDDIFLKRR